MNLTSAAQRGRSVLESALATSSTRVRIRRNADDLDEATVDFATLEVTDPTPAKPIASNVQALITSLGADTRPIGRGREDHPPTHNVWLPVSVVDVQELDLLDVTAGLDPMLDGATLLVTEVLTDAIGVGRHLHARQL